MRFKVLGPLGVSLITAVAAAAMAACGGGDPTSTPARAAPTVAPPPVATSTPVPTATPPLTPTATPVSPIPTANQEARAAIYGDWEGATLYRRNDLATIVHFESREGRIQGTLDFPQIGRRGLPLSKISFEPPKVHFELSAFDTVFDGELNGDTISGEFVDPDGSGPFNLTRMSP